MRLRSTTKDALLQDFPDEPHVPEGIHDGALQDPPDRLRSSHIMLVFAYRTSLNSSGRQSLPMHRCGIVHEELDPDGRETHGSRTSRTVRRRLVREEELDAVDRKSSDGAIPNATGR
jgi:hypothetical protein